ncbi:amino acid adenylation domain-containing protein [Tychonema sp. LEGE 07199]|uniref:non-ribosomal peptide synthetase n=1 Tax=unclassified Tychonema TaxID=2642144 RepID=UPI0018802460|nr:MULTISPECIES: non-ribosomal peptide synthetase [unclassified Tychonema]MBE9121162.1 amino acid adenylation domain-containing protein [Tychonema sp. LEGE 07199]MBE9133325.1 amino acid adenylation domain-containing protein [Tychonema sp. LEGE 07196]
MSLPAADRPQSVATDSESSYQLSPLQQGMLFEGLSGQQSGVDIEQVLCSLGEELNVSAFVDAWHQSVDRYPVLRTSFSWLDREVPVQTVHPQVEVPIVDEDWRSLSQGDRTRQLATFLQADRLQGFDLTQPPLMRLALFRVAETEYKLIWTYHHILLDSTSAITVLQAVFTLYEALTGDRQLELTPPRCDRDASHRMQQDISKTEAFWRQYLSGLGDRTPLVGDFYRTGKMPVPQENSSVVEQERGLVPTIPEIRLSSTVTAALNSLIHEQQLTLNTLLQGVWALLLSRCSGSQDVVFGTICNSRSPNIEKTEPAVGLFINTLPLRVIVTPEMPAIDWLKQLQNQWTALQEHGNVPLAKIQEWSEISRSSALFESLVVVEKTPINAALQTLGGNWQNREFQLLEQTSFPLTVYGYGGDEMLLKIAGDRQRFDENVLTRMLGHLQTLLESIAANPQQKISKLSMLTAAEIAQLQQWNQTEANYPDNKCVHQLFEAQADRSPDAIAAVFPHNSRQQLTYRELNSKANQLAHYLQQLGVGPDVLVAICMERSLEMAIAVLGILKTGAAYVPIDPAYPKERLTFMLADTKTPVILTQSHLVSGLPEHQARTVCLDANWQEIANYSTENPASTVSPDNLTYTIYTSGSTGKPKGVLLPHRALVNLIAWQLQNSTLEDAAKTLQFASLSFDVSFQEMFCTWCAGGTLVFITEEIRRDAQSLLQLIEREKIQRLFLPFIALQHLAEAADTYKLVPKSLREVITAGEQLQVNRYITSFFQQLENCTLHNQYGPSESHVVTAYTLSGQPENWPALPAIGRPIANTQIYLLHQNGEPVPLGVGGELYIGGICLARGYLNRPDLTAQRFIPNPFKHNEKSTIEQKSDFSLLPSEDRLYKTGDLARYLPDGNIEYIGRIDGQVKIRGFRIELGEIETALAKHPAIKQAVVLAREDTPGDKRLVAYLAVNPEEQLTIADLRVQLQGQLPDYMVPAVFVTVEAMPKTPSGKIDRRALPAPDSQRQEQSQSYAAPQSELEKVLAGIWSKLLKLDRVGIHDNFFEIGGNSLMTLKVAVQVRALLATDLPVVKLFQHPTIAQLANYLNQGQSASPSTNKFQDRADRQKAAFNRSKQFTKRR